VIGRVAEAVGPAAELEAAVPARRRLERLAALRTLADAVVGGALFLVAQHFVGFVEFLHSRRRIGSLADVRMVLAREAAKRLLDLVVAGRALDTQCLVVVLELHRACFRSVAPSR
jgi:hypothetical protein